MAGGEIGNFLALGMASASLVSPLGAVTGKVVLCELNMIHPLTDFMIILLQLYRMRCSRGFS
jgi:hypothetical protein